MGNKEYKTGYLEGQLDEAETVYHNLSSILNHICEEPSDFAKGYLEELAKFLTQHGRL
ncbi:hypothetical protein M3Y14_32355 (plasmid) [Bacillus thuringiensis]|uniref:hypothetical protein n=1 Tax=Bacillus thuringiensis TaxID=1428 RepID=UPI0022257611|nr:hypothetical protein [Bacillus thuringiensis]UYX55924.1 hypothetical protein M3Y14_32355 [Bacillus thuringiensis]